MIHLNTYDVAKLAGCSATTVQAAIKRGELAAVRIGPKHLYIDPDIGRAWALTKVRVPRFSEFAAAVPGFQYCVDKHRLKARDLDRLAKDIFTEPNTGCWLWDGVWFASGRGQFTVGKYEEKKCLIVHRLVYELVNGPIPEGLVLDHLCRQPCCVNPQHLEPVTNEVNLKRGAESRGHRNKNSRSHCPAGHPYEGDNLYISKDNSRSCRTCRRQAQSAYFKRKTAASSPTPD